MSRDVRSMILETYSRAKQLHADVQQVLADAQYACRGFDPALIVDVTYGLKQAYQYVDQARKDIDKTLAVVQKLGCLVTAQSSENQLRGKWATGHAQAMEQPGVPHPDKEPEQYVEVMRALGADEELIATHMLRPSFDAVGKLAARLAAEGKPVPSALRHVKMIPRYTIVARCKKPGGLDDFLTGPDGAGSRSGAELDNPF